MVAIDGGNNIYLAGHTNSFGPGVCAVFIAKYTPSGTQQWNSTWGGGYADIATGIAMGNSNNIYITGHTTSFGAGSYDGFLLQYNESGAEQWYTTWGSSDRDYGRSIAIDNSDNIYITGIKSYSVSSGYGISILAKYNNSGSQQWNITQISGGGLATDYYGNLYIASSTKDSGAGGHDALLVKYNGSGIQQWNTTWGGTNDDKAISIATGGFGDIYITGGTKSFGAGDYDAFLARYSYVNIIKPLLGKGFGLIPPNFTIEVTVPKLDTTWYSLNGAKNITFTTNGTLNEGEWGSLPDGIIKITFYANDTAGNVASDTVNIIKDTIAPNIIIISPNQGENVGPAAPSFIVRVNDSNPDKMWYSLNGAKNITFTTNGTLNEGEWGSLPDGIIKITFYANDTAGNVASDTVNIIKDTIAPNIIIISPNQGENVGPAAPSFIVRVNDSNPDKMWYSLNGAKNITFTTNGTLNEGEWGSLPDGTVELTFYANDTAGNVGSESIELVKETSSDQIPGYPLLIIVPMALLTMVGLYYFIGNFPSKGKQ